MPFCPVWNRAGKRYLATPHTDRQRSRRWGEVLQGGWNLTPALLLDDEPLKLLGALHYPGRRDRGEQDEDVAVPRCSVGDHVVADRRVPGDRLGVDGEDDRGDVARAVVVGDRVDARGAVAGLEVLRGGVEEPLRKSGVAVVVDLDVDVDVDGLEGLEVELVGHAFSPSVVGAVGAREASAARSCSLRILPVAVVGMSS